MKTAIGMEKTVARRVWMREAAFGLGGLFLISCGGTQTAQAPEEEPKKIEAVTAMRAFTFAYGKARSKAPDLQVFSISNLNLEGVPSGEGKAGAWQFQFVSPGKKALYSLRYAVADELPSFREGAWDTGMQAYNEGSTRAKPFAVQALRCDSDAAFEIAAENAADYLKKEGVPPVNFHLEMNADYALPMWRVYWGHTLSTAEYSVFIDANQSKFLKKGKG